MKTMLILAGNKAFRWSGGSFIAVWEASRINEYVPDDMIQLPDSLNRSKTTRDDIQRIVEEYVR